MPEHTPNTPRTHRKTTQRNTSQGTGPVPQTAAEWRAALRKDPLPDEVTELPLRQRRRAKKAWRSARRDERVAWIKAERRKVPTPLTVPIVALTVAGLIAGAAWLWPHNNDQPPLKAAPTPSAHPTTPDNEPTHAPTPTPTPTPTSAHPTTPDAVAQAFTTAYTTRIPLQDGTHTAAVQRAAPYASTALVDNLKHHDDADFNKLIAAQATQAKPSKVEIAQPTEKQRPAPDTSIRLWRQATVTIDVKGTDAYRYTRHLTLEVSRADVGRPWAVTRVLGVEE
ncbi:hypothetical protein ACIQU6_38495 [Streptomyces sp. NPDC090442]|uniref:hypothetical protein n=1 Tax=Streptomyces sp. NPDC090442 TaxID=3365962 RepID=UPI003815E897